MLSLFSLPKAFTGHSRVIQDNAVGSWTRLVPACDIVLFGNDPGVAEAAVRYGVRHESITARNEFGTPLIGDVFARMDTIARNNVIAFVNADIILLSDFMAAVRAVTRSRERFLLISSRFNVRIEHPLPFSAGWDSELRALARDENRMYPAGGSDVFVYPRGLFQAVPSFAIGRGYWDNWLMCEALRAGAFLIDATATMTAVHQNHTYEHPLGLFAGQDERDVYTSKEGQCNLKLAGGLGRIYTAFDASEVLVADGRLLSTWRPLLIRRHLKASLRRALKKAWSTE